MIHVQLVTLLAGLTLACEVYHAVSSPAFGLLRELLQLPACLSLMGVACLVLFRPSAVIAGELEGSWRAGGQQEGLQYNGEAAG